MLRPEWLMVDDLENYYDQESVSDATLDRLYDNFEILLEGTASGIEFLLSHLTVERLPSDLCLAVLTNAAARKTELRQYASFYARVLMKLALLDGQEAAVATLRGLEP